MSHTKDEVDLMAEYFGYKGVPGWIFMAALTEWRLSSTAVLNNAKEWEASGKPEREEWKTLGSPMKGKE